MASLSVRWILVFSALAALGVEGNTIVSYASEKTLIDIADKIGNMFKIKNYTIPSTQESFYKNETTIVVNNITKTLEIFDRKLVNFRYYSRPPDHSKKLEQIFNDGKDSFISDVEKINKNYDLYKNISKIMATTDGSEFAELPDILRTLNNSMMKIHLAKWKIISDLENLTHALGEKEETELLNKVLIDHIAGEQSVIFNFYIVIVASQLKELAMNVYNYHYKYATSEINWNMLNSKIQSKVESTKQQIRVDAAQMTLMIENMARTISNNDPEKIERDINFFELEKVFQTIVVPNYGLVHENSCVGHCSELNYKHKSGSDKKYCLDGNCASCTGKLKNCFSAPSIATCQPAEPKGARKYEWLQTCGRLSSQLNYFEPENIKETLGPMPTKESIKEKTGRRDVSFPDYCGHGAVSYYQHFIHGILGIGTMCDYCVCNCEENTHLSTESTFIISSLPATTNATNNRVVTGIRFVKKDKIIYPQIKEGKLLAGGMIDQSTDNWLDFKILDRSNVTKEIKKKIELKLAMKFEDFIVVGDDSKIVNLDDINCPSDDHVVTGVSLKRGNSGVNKNRIQLSIQCHRFDFLNGSFTDKKPTIITEEKPHTNILETNRMPPERLKKSFNIESEKNVNNQAIEITISNKYKDAGQSVVPYFDAQNVTGTIAAPLYGIGLYHRGGTGSGGFLAFRLTSIDHNRFIEENIN